MMVSDAIGKPIHAGRGCALGVVRRLRHPDVAAVHGPAAAGI